MRWLLHKLVVFIATAAFGLMLNGSIVYAVTDTTIVATSFESSEPGAVTLGSINGQGKWAVTVGAGNVVENADSAHSGSRRLKILADLTALRVQHTAYANDQQGVTGVVYFDMYVRIAGSTGKEFTINGNDLFGGSRKRTFVIDFTIPVNDTGSIRIYTGSTKTRLQRYDLRTWYRLSGKVDYTAETYVVCVNGVNPVSAAFRESYIPTANGARPATVKEYHQLLFNLGADTNSGSLDAAVDDLYVGTVAPLGVNFGNIASKFTVTVTQPQVGSITLTPSGTQFAAGTSVTAKLTLPAGYKNGGWTGDVSGVDSTVTFTVTKAMTIGASVLLDTLNPPALYRVSVIQPAFGTIAVSPAAVRADSFYAYTKLTATLSVPSGYKNGGWTRGLSGTALSGTVTLLRDTTFAANVIPIPPGTRQVYSGATAFKNAIKAAVAGDTIELTDGIYDVGKVSLTINGTAQYPIRIRASRRGGVELNGGSGFILTYCSYVILEGFTFTGDPGTAVKFESCNNVRVTRNVFRLNETSSGKWVYIGGRYDQQLPNSHHNRVDHNLFEEKHLAGNFLTLDGSPDNMPDGSVNPTPRASQYDRIDHNHFRNIGPRVVNEMEAVRLGVSHLTQSSAFCVVEYNLFEDCDGDPEFVSVKSSDDTIRFNTFRRSLGTLCLRAGNRTVVEGNFFFGEGKTAQFTDPSDGSVSTIGTGGVRAYADDHKIFNNYFEGLTGDRWDAALTFTNGDVDYPSTSYTSHFRPRRILAAFNTMVNNAHNIQIGYTGSGYSKPPQELLIANNLVCGSQNELVKLFTTPVLPTFEGNVAYPTGTAVLGMSATSFEFTLADPLLTFADSVWWLGSASPAINAAYGAFDVVATDIQGQPRSVPKDVGADEYSTAPVLRRPLRAADVGPNGPEEIVTTVHEFFGRVIPGTIRLSECYPNPFNPSTQMEFTVSKPGATVLRVYNLIGQQVATLFSGNADAGRIYQVSFDAARLPSGLYVARLEADGKSVARKLTLMR